MSAFSDEIKKISQEFTNKNQFEAFKLWIMLTRDLKVDLVNKNIATDIRNELIYFVFPHLGFWIIKFVCQFEAANPKRLQKGQNRIQDVQKTRQDIPELDHYLSLRQQLTDLNYEYETQQEEDFQWLQSVAETLRNQIKSIENQNLVFKNMGDLLDVEQFIQLHAGDDEQVLRKIFKCTSRLILNYLLNIDMLNESTMEVGIAAFLIVFKAFSLWESCYSFDFEIQKMCNVYSSRFPCELKSIYDVEKQMFEFQNFQPCIEEEEKIEEKKSIPIFTPKFDTIQKQHYAQLLHHDPESNIDFSDVKSIFDYIRYEKPVDYKFRRVLIQLCGDDDPDIIFKSSTKFDQMLKLAYDMVYKYFIFLAKTNQPFNRSIFETTLAASIMTAIEENQRNQSFLFALPTNPNLYEQFEQKYPEADRARIEQLIQMEHPQRGCRMIPFDDARLKQVLLENFPNMNPNQLEIVSDDIWNVYVSSQP